MKLYLLLIVVLAVKGQDNDKHECEVGYLEKLAYTKKNGCVFNATCVGSNGWLGCLWSESSIEAPSDNATPYFDLKGKNPDSSESFDMFSYFGIICEDGSWYATKYPTGIDYRVSENDHVVVGSPKEYNGMKSKIDDAICWTPF
ncbi:unnamed protein product [Caenorhabditis brenneri]